jgi:hypothetical protein
MRSMAARPMIDVHALDVSPQGVATLKLENGERQELPLRKLETRQRAAPAAYERVWSSPRK